jgi:hypothetical protein
MCSPRGDTKSRPAPAPVFITEPSKYRVQHSAWICGGGSCVSVYSATKSTRIWDLTALRGGNELLARSQRRVWVVDVEVGVDAVAGLYAQLPRTLAARRGFSRHRGAEQPYRSILLRQLGFEFAGLG